MFMALLSTALWQPTVQANSATAPGAPANLAATSGDSQVTLTWEAPSSNGGADITGYEHRHHFGVSNQSWPEWTSAGTALTVTVTGLINGRDYTFEVRAVNSVGGGTASSVEATPTGAGPLTSLSVEPGTSSGGSVPVHRPGTISPTFNSSTYDYTATVLHSDTHLTFNATTETGYGKDLRIVGNLGLGGFWFSARDLGPDTAGHQVRLSYGENRFRYAIYKGQDGTESDGTSEYHYHITVTRPYPPLEISGPSENKYAGNDSRLVARYHANFPGHDPSNQTWSLTGTDSDNFTLEEDENSQQVLSFSQTPDPDNPSDSGTNNVYEVTVQVSEGSETATLAVTITVNSPATGAPTISGTAQVGQNLTADTSGISDANGLTTYGFDYRWLADDETISGTTGYVYTVRTSDVGKTIKVVVTITDDAGFDESLTSAGTSAVVLGGL